MGTHGGVGIMRVRVLRYTRLTRPSQKAPTAPWIQSFESADASSCVRHCSAGVEGGVELLEKVTSC